MEIRMVGKGATKLFLFLFLLWGWETQAFAGTLRYASANGLDNSSNCTTVQSGTGACSLSRALNQMAGGDTLELANGVYIATCSECLPNGSAGAPTTLRAANRRQAIFRPSSTPGEAIFHMDNRSYQVFDGLVIDCASSGNRCAGFDEGSMATSDNITIQNSEITGGRGPFGSGITGTYTDSLFKGNFIHDNGGPGKGSSGGCWDSGQMSDVLAHNVYIHGTNVTIEDNEISNARCGFGITLYWQSAPTSNKDNVVRRNYVHDNPYLTMDIGAYNSTSGPNTAYDNLVVNNGRGIEVGGNNSSVHFNTIVNNFGNCIEVRGASGTLIRNNICWTNDSNIITNGGSGTVASNNRCDTAASCNLGGGSNSTTNAPGFVSTTDYHLGPASLMIDAATPVSGITTDIDNSARITGTAPDIGADERAGGGTGSGNTRTSRAVENCTGSAGALSGTWTQLLSSPSLNRSGSDVCVGGAGVTAGLARYTGATFTDKQYSQIRYTSVGTNGGIGAMVQAQGTNSTVDFYFINVYDDAGTKHTEMAKLVDGVKVAVYGDVTSETWATGDLMAIEVVGSNLWGFHNGTVVFTASDPTPLTGGTPGALSDSTSSLDDFDGGDLNFIGGVTGAGLNDIFGNTVIQ